MSLRAVPASPRRALVARPAIGSGENGVAGEGPGPAGRSSRIYLRRRDWLRARRARQKSSAEDSSFAIMGRAD